VPHNRKNLAISETIQIKSNQIVYSPPTRYIQNARMHQYFNRLLQWEISTGYYIAFNPGNLDCVKKRTQSIKRNIHICIYINDRKLLEILKITFSANWRHSYMSSFSKDATFD
jgi:hypothetical protein